MERTRGVPVQCDPYNNLFERPGSESFARLFNAEEYFMVPRSYLNDWVKKALRRTAIEIMESLSSTSSDFDALIPYTAMTYFDRYLSRKNYFPSLVTPIGGRNTRLFVICCLTIAWKLRNKSFNLSTFLRERHLDYSTKDVLRMELEICRGLEWRMRTLTPFYFVEFFIPVLHRPPNLPSPRSAVRHLIVRSQCDIAFTEFRPSVMAASAMLIVSSKMFPDQHTAFDLKITTDVEPLRLLKDMILKCNNKLTPLYGKPPIRKPRDIAIQIDEPAAPEPPYQPSPATPSQPIPIPGGGARQDLGGPPRKFRTPWLQASSSLGTNAPTSGNTQPAESDWEDDDDDRKEPATDETQPLSFDERELFERSVQEEPRPRQRPGKEPAISETQPEEPRPSHRPVKESAASEIHPEEPKPSHRPGKEVATSEIQPAASEDDDEELMDFELGWIELLEEREGRDGPGAGRAWFILAYIVGGLAYYWVKCMTAYENIKNKAGAGQCNIL